MKQIGILTDSFEIVKEIMSGVQSFMKQQDYKYVRSRDSLYCSEAEIEILWIKPTPYCRGYFLDKVFVDRNLESLELERKAIISIEMLIDRAKRVEYI